MVRQELCSFLKKTSGPSSLEGNIFFMPICNLHQVMKCTRTLRTQNMQRTCCSNLAFSFGTNFLPARNYHLRQVSFLHEGLLQLPPQGGLLLSTHLTRVIQMGIGTTERATSASQLLLGVVFTGARAGIISKSPALGISNCSAPHLCPPSSDPESTDLRTHGLCRAQRTVSTTPAHQTLLGDRDGWVNGAVGEIFIFKPDSLIPVPRPHPSP
ncbi:uncharacterized protein LOC117013772 [Rhinolophus ferrumequinum]|uniref:uncharacterized protein LOC117013772 n=1 Tax=Rhinolophus ferrumequinum TaxID=59479 RepID=UPI00140FB082|nr:uncharacterized protein LOC117013772 [Rhinolophus ferrumequinum]